MIEIRYFASLRERLGTAREQVPAGAAAADVGAIVNLLRQRGGAWEEAFGEAQTVLMAVNQEVAGSDTPVHDGDEVAFFPPVTGG